MLTLLVTGIVVALPVLFVVALLLLAERFQRAQQARVACQIAVTDAIHRELGAVVAPSITTRPWGRPRLVIPAPLEKPGVVGSVLDIAHRTLRASDSATGHRVEIVVVPQAERRPAPARRAA
jgi:hypothetical protein